MREAIVEIMQSIPNRFFLGVLFGGVAVIVIAAVFS